MPIRDSHSAQARRPALTPEQRSLRAKVAAHSLHARHDSREITAPARAAADTNLNRRLLSEVDPDGSLSEAERQRRLEHARKAHFARLALKSARARRKNSNGNRGE